MRKINPDICLLYAEAAFKSVIGEPRPFGSPSGSNYGFSDGNDGVQWNIDIDKLSSIAKLGINLEGKKYTGWPIAVFIENERKNHNLVKLFHGQKDSSRIFVSLYRDAWQAASRPPIDEKIICNVPLDKLTASKWSDLLLEAYQCLDSNKDYRGRARQLVTLKTGKRLMGVSPHLHIYTIAWNQKPASEGESKRLLQEAVGVLRPLYDFVKKSSLSH